ncbi:hypothetical protein BD324DRAFT_92593 [Kockovaella imperatae]|uniref:Uncharacterized protein n=1 Tax=Kockovaella imperatae TaxID=4999 RepID=A0A1Y1UBD4_9TREE|nr:hypothetical protein BD324DRAFT_92593 [Kockovaella imperatae]ORX35351.1 hypothetical protein BD324DRAFT_92593 [Kockovaella imperatae]
MSQPESQSTSDERVKDLSPSIEEDSRWKEIPMEDVRTRFIPWDGAPASEYGYSDLQEYQTWRSTEGVGDIIPRPAEAYPTRQFFAWDTAPDRTYGYSDATPELSDNSYHVGCREGSSLPLEYQPWHSVVQVTPTHVEQPQAWLGYNVQQGPQGEGSRLLPRTVTSVRTQPSANDFPAGSSSGLQEEYQSQEMVASSHGGQETPEFWVMGEVRCKGSAEDICQMVGSWFQDQDSRRSFEYLGEPYGISQRSSKQNRKPAPKHIKSATGKVKDDLNPLNPDLDVGIKLGVRKTGYPFASVLSNTAGKDERFFSAPVNTLESINKRREARIDPQASRGWSWKEFRPQLNTGERSSTSQSTKIEN